MLNLKLKNLEFTCIVTFVFWTSILLFSFPNSTSADEPKAGGGWMLKKEDREKWKGFENYNIWLKKASMENFNN